MPFWPFKKTPPEPLTPEELRDRLIEVAAGGSPSRLRKLCRQYKAQVAQNVDVLRTIPEGIRADEAASNRHFQCLIAVAQCLANECKSPELWNALCGNAADNPLIRWDNWFRELPERIERLEYETLISEAEIFLEKAKGWRGGSARQYEAYFSGRLGELLFHSGRALESIAPFESALSLCVEHGDVEGQLAYLTNLLEVHCYLDDDQILPTAEKLLEARRQNGVPTDDLERRIRRLRQSESLCRIVCVLDGKELELDEISNVGDGRYQFRFRRNRLSLQKAVTLTRQGNDLASSGRHSDALGKYDEASEVDPHDPDPIYQSGMCLLELGAYAQGRAAFEEVERLAPGWFRCRSDAWLAHGLTQGSISPEEFQLVRVLDDGDLKSDQALALARDGITRFPDFAPLYLLLGDRCSEEAEAIAAYRKGLDLVQEPDLESRLLCALAGRLPVESPERRHLVERALGLNGNLVAMASARLIGLR